MRFAYQAIVCLLIVITFASSMKISAEESFLASGRKTFRTSSNQGMKALTPEKLFRSKTSRSYVVYTGKYTEEILFNLYDAVQARLGRPYKYGGTDDRGYDCSGFIWRVFYDAGVEFDRSPTRRLWEGLPEATPKEQSQYGTLVFFEGLTHVGIVADDKSFYHASSSKGVIRSQFAGYWGPRVIGYRRILIPAILRER